MKRNNLSWYWLIGLFALFVVGCSGAAPETNSPATSPAAAPTETAAPADAPTNAPANAPATAVPDAPEQPTGSEQGTTTPIEEPDPPPPAVTEPPPVAEPAARPQLVEFYADW
jgi:hypothetical protein